MIDKNDIDELLETWYNTKLQISVLEKKCEKFKRYCEKIMDEMDKNTLSSDEYSLKRTMLTKTTVSKKDLPKDIWNKYCSETSYTAFYLKPKKFKKKSRSKKVKCKDKK